MILSQLPLNLNFIWLYIKVRRVNVVDYEQCPSYKENNKKNLIFMPLLPFILIKKNVILANTIWPANLPLKDF